MGRSVGIHRESVATAYTYNEDLGNEWFNYDDYLLYLFEQLSTKYKRQVYFR